jgi:hypothetical protein
MGFSGNFHSGWTHVQRDNFAHTLLVVLVSCAVGATAGAAVILSLVSSLIIQPRLPSISPRVTVRSISASETANIAQDRPTMEIPTPPAAFDVISDPEELVTQTEAGHQEEHSHQSRKYSRVVVRSREHYWPRRFMHNFSQSPRFSSW